MDTKKHTSDHQNWAFKSLEIYVRYRKHQEPKLHQDVDRLTSAHAHMPQNIDKMGPSPHVPEMYYLKGLSKAIFVKSNQKRNRVQTITSNVRLAALWYELVMPEASHLPVCCLILSEKSQVARPVEIGLSMQVPVYFGSSLSLLLLLSQLTHTAAPRTRHKGTSNRHNDQEHASLAAAHTHVTARYQPDISVLAFSDEPNVQREFATITLVHVISLLVYEYVTVVANCPVLCPLPPEEEKELKETLQEILGKGKKVKVEQKIDPSILGGLVVEFGQKVFDMSIKTRAAQMERFLRQPINLDGQ
ncbi:UNVERIFIED_CONTAM: ATP synthase subunit O, mitochondrial [Sesamum calycinum]|uniref:ATP synthase subunit O, mitochondrial n=1 Tax=Sesamum calycinum TaxID=2727403 RepID=A0AAW2NUA6_9LAMI